MVNVACCAQAILGKIESFVSERLELFAVVSRSLPLCFHSNGLGITTSAYTQKYFTSLANSKQKCVFSIILTLIEVSEVLSGAISDYKAHVEGP